MNYMPRIDSRYMILLQQIIDMLYGIPNQSSNRSGDTIAVRPISVLRFWISEGLTQAES